MDGLRKVGIFCLETERYRRLTYDFCHLVGAGYGLKEYLSICLELDGRAKGSDSDSESREAEEELKEGDFGDEESACVDDIPGGCVSILFVDSDDVTG